MTYDKRASMVLLFSWQQNGPDDMKGCLSISGAGYLLPSRGSFRGWTDESPVSH